MLPGSTSSGFGATIADSLTLFIDLDQSSLGLTSPEVVAAVRHLCGWSFPEDPVDPIEPARFISTAQNYYQHFSQADPAGTSALALVSYVSAFFHEIRHIHDLLATTYGQDVLFSTLQYIQNTPWLVHELADWQSQAAGRKIPLPLADNLERMPGASDELTKFVLSYRKRREDLERYHAPINVSPAGLRVRYLLESSAVDIQLTFIRDVFGEGAIFDLLDFIRAGADCNVYLQIRNEVQDLLYLQGRHLEALPTILNFLLWCSLTGTTFPDAKYADGPNHVLLFEALLEHVVREVREFDLSNVRKSVQDFCNLWGFLSWEQMVARNTRKFEDRALKIVSAWEGRKAPPELDFGDAYLHFIAAYDDINRWIFEQAGDYFQSDRYVTHILQGHLPRAPVKLKLNGVIHDFMTRGLELVPFEKWELISSMSTMFKVIMEGRGSCSSPLWEDYCWESLNEDPWGGITLEFRDCSPLFSW